jgi:ParB/RepB/Spo0J family partition protein
MTDQKNETRVTVAPEVRLLPLSLIDPSRTNPRKRFEGIEELAADFKIRGVLQPILVRPAPGPSGARYEIVFGERRYRAAKLAALEVIPATVRLMSDADVLETQIVENIRRQDIHPLEEAEGYERLREAHGRTIPELAKLAGRTEGWVHARIKLLALCPAGRQAYLEGRLANTVALYVARIPSVKLQEKAILAVAPKAGEPLNARAASDLIQSRFMLSLYDAQFDRKDSTLVPKAGSCDACPKRTGNQKLLFPEIRSKDSCTDPDCFAEKQAALWTRRKAAHVAKGLPVLSDAESRQLFGAYSSRPTSGDYHDLDSECYNDPKVRTFRELLPKNFGPICLARDGRGGIHEMYEDNVAFRRALSSALPAERPRESLDTPKDKAMRAATRTAIQLIGIRAARTGLPLRLVLRAMLGASFGDKSLIGAHGEKELRVAKDPAVRAVIVTLAASEVKGPLFGDFCKSYRIDLASLVRKELRAFKVKAKKGSK